MSIKIGDLRGNAKNATIGLVAKIASNILGKEDKGHPHHDFRPIGGILGSGQAYTGERPPAQEGGNAFGGRRPLDGII